MLNCLFHSHSLQVCEPFNKKMTTHFLFSNKQYWMHLPTELTALSCSMTTFSLVIFIEIVNIAVKIQWKINHEAGRGWMLPHANRSTACSLPQLNKEPLQCWALLERDSKHLESNWRTITSSKVRSKNAEGQHFEKAVPSFREAVKQEI